MQLNYRPQPGLKRRPAGGFNREHAAFIIGVLLVAAFEVMLMAKGVGY